MGLKEETPTSRSDQINQKDLNPSYFTHSEKSRFKNIIVPRTCFHLGARLFFAYASFSNGVPLSHRVSMRYTVNISCMFTVFFPVLFSASATLISILRSRVDPSSTICTNRVHGINRQWLVNRVRAVSQTRSWGPTWVHVLVFALALTADSNNQMLMMNWLDLVWETLP